MMSIENALHSQQVYALTENSSEHIAIFRNVVYIEHFNCSY